MKLSKMVVQYNQQCMRCRKNYVLVSGRNNYPLCYECQKTELNQPIKDKKMKEFFNIPEEFYKESQFLRNIKIYYIKFKELSEKQKEFFKKVVEEMKNSAKKKEAYTSKSPNLPI